MMATTTRNLRRYDHRLREFVLSTGDVQQAIHRGAARSSAHGWLKSPRTEVVTINVAYMDVLQLQQELLTLQRRVARLIALLRLLVILLRMSGFSLAGTRIHDGAEKQRLMRAIGRSRTVLPLRVVLRVLQLSHSSYCSWTREEECGLDDIKSCPRSSPQQLTPAEVDTIKKMVTFYVAEHNSRLPHSAFWGQTPDEMYFATGSEIPCQLEIARKASREARMEFNRNNSCRTCEPLEAISS